MAGCLTVTMAQAETISETRPKKVVTKPSVKQKAGREAEIYTGPLLDEEGKVFSANGAVATDVNCELGNKLTLYRDGNDTDHMSLRWNRRVHQMTRVSTSTGANRFENVKSGLVWIGIPAKGMLLDSKRGQQLANECKDAEQMAIKPAVVVEPAKPTNVPLPVAVPRIEPKP